MDTEKKEARRVLINWLQDRIDELEREELADIRAGLTSPLSVHFGGQYVENLKTLLAARAASAVLKP
jgi:hypothetical protein